MMHYIAKSIHYPDDDRTTATEPQIGRPRKMTGRGQRMPRSIVRRGWQPSSKLHVALALAQEQCVESLMDGFPWPSSCIQALRHNVLCKASYAVL